MTIRSPRLDLVPMTPAFLRACLDRQFPEASAILGIKVPATWAVHEAPLEYRLSQLEADPSLQPWLLRAIGLRDTGEMIGFIGFHTAPGPGYLAPWLPDAVEFGFTIFADYRCRGYATEASRALMQWATDQYGVKNYVLTVSPANAASRAVAAKLGFTRIGEHVDEVDGVEEILALIGAGDPPQRQEGSG